MNLKKNSIYVMNKLNHKKIIIIFILFCLLFIIPKITGLSVPCNYTHLSPWNINDNNTTAMSNTAIIFFLFIVCPLLNLLFII